MTTKEELVKQKLKSKVFDIIGKSVTFKSKGTPTYNTRGEEESVTYTSSTITVVPYNIIESRQSYEPFGDLQEGEMDVAVPYEVSITKEDILTIESVDYEVKEVVKNFLPGNVVTIVRVSKVQ